MGLSPLELAPVDDCKSSTVLIDVGCSRINVNQVSANAFDADIDHIFPSKGNQTQSSSF